ncbi:MAG: phosphatase PAP2 family protein, partial [Minisyncoccales bacterium]
MKELIIFFAKYLIFPFPFFAGLSLLSLSWPKKRRMLYLAFVSGIVLFFLREIASQVFFDPRPFITNPEIKPFFSHAPDNGFPSDHTLLAFWLALLVFLYHKKFGFVLIIFSVLIGLAR